MACIPQLLLELRLECSAHGAEAEVTAGLPLHDGSHGIRRSRRIAGFEQYYDIFPGYGRGIQGYFKRYGAAYSNDFSARMLASGVFASLFHQDPRYFYKGTRSFQSRALYAISCAYVTRDDQGRRRPNYSHVLGVFASAALSNLYYPKGSRGLRLTPVNGAVETAGNSGTDLVRESILKGITSHAGEKP